MTYSVPRETFSLLREVFNDDKKAENFVIGIEKSVQEALDDKKEKLKDELKNELATKEFVEAKFLALDKKFTVYFVVLLAAILLVNKDAIELVAKLLGIAHP